MMPIQNYNIENTDDEIVAYQFRWMEHKRYPPHLFSFKDSNIRFGVLQKVRSEYGNPLCSFTNRLYCKTNDSGCELNIKTLVIRKVTFNEIQKLHEAVGCKVANAPSLIDRHTGRGEVITKPLDWLKLKKLAQELFSIMFILGGNDNTSLISFLPKEIITHILTSGKC